MEKEKLATHAETTWCPGCHNYLLLESVKMAIKELIEEGKVKHEEVSMAAGIGCHGKMFDYLNVGGVYSLHGRVLPACLGMKLGNPGLTVLGFAGDGDTYSEGMGHFIHAARHNSDINLIVHNNQVFALTTGQATATSEYGFKSKAQPFGEIQEPVNPLKLALAAGASFVSRVYPKDIQHTKKVIKEALKHKGYSLIDAAVPCLAYHEDTKFLEGRMYKLEEEGHDPTDKEEAWEKACEWDYNLDEGKIPVGIFYKERRKTLEEKKPQLKKLMKKDEGWWQVDRS